MRITNKVEIKTSDGHTDFAYDTSAANIIELPHLVEGQRYTGEVIFKLGQLEDIEEELEMPIDKFFQALFGSAKMLKVWCIHPHKGLQEVFLNSFENHETARYFNAFNIDVGSITLGLSQYGKTWALTREELEK